MMTNMCAHLDFTLCWMINSNIGTLNWSDIEHWLMLCRLNWVVCNSIWFFCTLVLYFCLLKWSFQVDRSIVVRREKELNAKVESAEAARNSIDNADSRIVELELQLQKSITEKNDLEIQMEEAIQDSGQIWYLLIFVVMRVMHLLMLVCKWCSLLQGGRTLKQSFV